MALQGDLGKPRPALVMQSDLFDAHPSVTVLPVTSEKVNALLFRLTLVPDAGNGLQRPSQVMVDKPQSVQRQRLGPSFGHVDDETMLAVNRALAVLLVWHEAPGVIEAETRAKQSHWIASLGKSAL